MPIDDVMSQGQLAAHLGRSLQKVQRWSAAGVLVPAADGNGYDVASSVRAIVGI